jgi:hypothetical protein
MKAFSESRDIAPPILNCGAGWRRVVSITLWLFFPPGKKLRYVWAKEGPITDLDFLEKGNISCPSWDLNLGASGAQSRDGSVGITTC